MICNAYIIAHNLSLFLVVGTFQRRTLTDVDDPPTVLGKLAEATRLMTAAATRATEHLHRFRTDLAGLQASTRSIDENTEPHGPLVDALRVSNLALKRPFQDLLSSCTEDWVVEQNTSARVLALLSSASTNLQ